MNACRHIGTRSPGWDLTLTTWLRCSSPPSMICAAQQRTARQRSNQRGDETIDHERTKGAIIGIPTSAKQIMHCVKQQAREVHAVFRRVGCGGNSLIGWRLHHVARRCAGRHRDTNLRDQPRSQMGFFKIATASARPPEDALGVPSIPMHCPHATQHIQVL